MQFATNRAQARSYSFTFTPFNSASSFFLISACGCVPGWYT